MFHSYCIVSDNLKNSQIDKLLSSFRLHPADINYVDSDPIGILQVRQLISALAKKPIASKYKASILAADKLTLEASQALLKTLEEPSDSSLIFLVTKNLDHVLPTIISRCTIINLTDKVNSPKTDFQKPLIFWAAFFQKSAGDRLKLTPELGNDRITITNWLSEQILFFRSELINSLTDKSNLSNLTIRKIILIIKQLVIFNGYNRSNVSIKLLLDQLFLSLPFKLELT